jgi:hypothetical protein
MCVTLMNPRTGGVFASFGAHPSFEVALERSLTELLQGRSFEGLNDLPQPTFASEAVTEPYNFVEHFIDSSGVVSWRFFSAKADFDFVEWDFSGQGENSNAEEAATLLGILEDMGKEVYTAVYDQLGATACRILVPGYSEIYPVEDLVWDNTNKSLLFREDILNLHRLDDASLEALLERLENNELDEYSDIASLIGIEFDENTDWGQLTVLELKLLINLALQQFEEAHELVGAFLQYNDNTVERAVLPGHECGAGSGARRRAGTGRLRRQFPPHVWQSAHGCGAGLGGRQRAFLRLDADQHEAGGAGPAPSPDRQLQEAAQGAGQGGGKELKAIAQRGAGKQNTDARFAPSLELLRGVVKKGVSFDDMLGRIALGAESGLWEPWLAAFGIELRSVSYDKAGPRNAVLALDISLAAKANPLFANAGIRNWRSLVAEDCVQVRVEKPTVETPARAYAIFHLDAAE